jgi:hypothetical protein
MSYFKIKLKMKKVIYMPLLVMVSMLTSCLTAGLEDIPEFEDAEITDVRFEFRYKDPNNKWIDGENNVCWVNLTVQNRVIDKNACTVTCTLAVPGASETFPESIRSGVSLSNIVGKFYLSTAASISPVEGSPTLGVPGDFSSARKYKVIAASGASKVWTVSVTGLTK